LAHVTDGSLAAVTKRRPGITKRRIADCNLERLARTDQMREGEVQTCKVEVVNMEWQKWNRSLLCGTVHERQRDCYFPASRQVVEGGSQNAGLVFKHLPRLEPLHRKKRPVHCRQN